MNIRGGDHIRNVANELVSVVCISMPLANLIADLYLIFLLDIGSKICIRDSQGSLVYEVYSVGRKDWDVDCGLASVILQRKVLAIHLLENNDIV